jgi:hypothetical protein
MTRTGTDLVIVVSLIAGATRRAALRNRRCTDFSRRAAPADVFPITLLRISVRGAELPGMVGDCVEAGIRLKPEAHEAGRWTAKPSEKNGDGNNGQSNDLAGSNMDPM